MFLPVVAYGSPILRKVCGDITADYEGLSKLIEDMWETMYASIGVGLAAPQINRSIRLFVVDTTIIFDDMDAKEQSEHVDAPGIKQVFINAQIVSLEGEPWAYEEGCLSIPKIRGDVYREETVTMSYLNENFEPQQKTFSGITARVILHEYDHIEGKLFIDHLKPLKRKMLQGKLDDISKGKVRVGYKMMFGK